MSSPPASVEPPPQSSQKRRLAQIFIKLTVVGVSLLISLLIAELAVRIIRPQHPSWLNFYAKSDVPPYGLKKNLTQTISNGVVTWTVHTNDRGIRVPAPARAATPQPSNAPILLTLGDSFLFGFAVDYDQTIPGYMQAALTDRWQVINAGVPGYGPAHYRQILEREFATGSPIKGVIATTYVGNDFFDCVTDRNLNVVDGILGDPGGFKSAVKRNSHLYRLAANAFHRIKQEKPDERPKEKALYDEAQWSTGKLNEASGIFRNEFTRIRDLCASHNVPLLVVVIPTDHAVSSATPPNDLPVKRTMALLNEAGIRCIDLTAPLVREGVKNTYLGWDFHFTARGNQTAADEIVRAWASLAK
jgi:hypothetical protein